MTCHHPKYLTHALKDVDFIHECKMYEFLDLRALQCFLNASNTLKPHDPRLSHTDRLLCIHYRDVIMSAMASQITGVSIAYSTVR